MSYYPPPMQGQDYSVNYYPNPPQPYGNEQYNQPGPFPVDSNGPPGGPALYHTPGPGQYPPPGPGQYPPPGPQEFPAYGQPYGQGYGEPGYGGDPVTNQPMQPVGRDWMTFPQGIPNCPPGLEYLISLSNLFVKQKVEFLEALTGRKIMEVDKLDWLVSGTLVLIFREYMQGNNNVGCVKAEKAKENLVKMGEDDGVDVFILRFETNNKFTIKNDRGEKMYWAVEDSDMCSRMCCGKLRPFQMRVMDAQKREIIHLNRTLACAVCCFPCCLQKMEVFAPPGNLLGTIEQNWSICYPDFSIKDAAGETVLKIEGPFCALPLCGNAEFQVLSRDGQVKVGKISKEWSGFARELFTDADYFGISFPLDLDVRMKAVMIGAVFLIDAMFFEKSN